MLDLLPVKLASGLRRSLQSFSLCCCSVTTFQLFNFVHGWEHLQGNPVDLYEQPEIGHSEKCKEKCLLEDSAVLDLFTVLFSNSYFSTKNTALQLWMSC